MWDSQIKSLKPTFPSHLQPQICLNEIIVQYLLSLISDIFFPSSFLYRKGTRIEETMRVQVHSKFCFLCVLTFLFHQGNHCHEQDNRHHHGGHKHSHSDLQISQAPYVRGAPLAPQSSSPQGHYLEEEQNFYIQQLFNRYGQKGRLDFHGFQSLLFSLGLGEVKVVGAKHDEFGHDHVSHLDLLDAQEGSNSPVKEGQSGHGHTHSHPHHDQGSHDPHPEPDQKGCNQQTTADTLVAGRPAENKLNRSHDDNHNHHHHDHHHDHHHNHTHHHDHDHDAEHNSNRTEVEDYGLKQDNGHVKETLRHKHKHGQSNNKNVAADVNVIPNTNQVNSSLVRPEPPSFTSTTVSQPRRPQISAPTRGQRRRNKITPPPSTSEDRGHQSEQRNDHHDDSGRNTRKDKREVSGGPGAPSLLAADLPLHQGELAHQHEEVGLD